MHRRRFELADDSWEPIANLNHALELIQEYWDAKDAAAPMPQIPSHYIKASWEPMAVFLTR